MTCVDYLVGGEDSSIFSIIFEFDSICSIEVACMCMWVYVVLLE